MISLQRSIGHVVRVVNNKKGEKEMIHFIVGAPTLSGITIGGVIGALIILSGVLNSVWKLKE